MDKIDLTTVIDRKTLVISCVECHLSCDRPTDRLLFSHTSLGLTLHDDELQDNLLYFLDIQGCTQIILLAHVNCMAIQYILDSEDSDRRVASLKLGLKQIISSNHVTLAPIAHRKRLLVELNLLSSAQKLMKQTCVSDRVSEGTLAVHGMIYNGHGLITIFKNGLLMNATMNAN